MEINNMNNTTGTTTATTTGGENSYRTKKQIGNRMYFLHTYEYDGQLCGKVWSRPINAKTGKPWQKTTRLFDEWSDTAPAKALVVYMALDGAPAPALPTTTATAPAPTPVPPFTPPPMPTYATYPQLRWYFNYKPKTETISRMIGYGWSSSEAHYAYGIWTAERERVGGPVTLDGGQ